MLYDAVVSATVSFTSLTLRRFVSNASRCSFLFAFLTLRMRRFLYVSSFVFFYASYDSVFVLSVNIGNVTKRSEHF